jgi:hypothetical protein
MMSQIERIEGVIVKQVAQMHTHGNTPTAEILAHRLEMYEDMIEFVGGK